MRTERSPSTIASVAAAAALALAALTAPTRALAFDEPPQPMRGQGATLEWLQIVGAPTLFMLGYLPSLTVGVAGVIGPEATRPYTWNFVPVAGPLVAATQCSQPDCGTTAFWTYAVTDTVFQAAGVIVLIVSMAVTPAPRTATTASNRGLRFVPSPLNVANAHGGALTFAF